jgi:hypothetical protein
MRNEGKYKKDVLRRSDWLKSLNHSGEPLKYTYEIAHLRSSALPAAIILETRRVDRIAQLLRTLSDAPNSLQRGTTTAESTSIT